MKTLRASLLRLLLAISISFSLWAFVSFSENPEETITFPDMTLQVVGLGEGLVVVDSNGLPSQIFPNIDVTLRTDRRQLATLRQVDVRVVANLSGLGPGEHIVPLNVEATRSNISINVAPDGVEPSAVTVRLEQLSTQSVPIRVAIQGNLPFSFERGEPQVSFGGENLSLVTVSGPQSRVLRVSEVRALVNIEQLRATYVAPLDLTPFDATGQAVEGVRLEPATVTVQVPINPVVGLKLVPVEPLVQGLPGPGYTVRSVSVTPPLIALAGSSGPLDTVDLLNTVPLDLAGAQRTISVNLPIIFPEGTSPREGEPATVTVTVEIVAIDQLFQAQLPAQIQVSGLNPSLLFTLNPTLLNVTVAGSSSALSELAQNPLRALVDVTGLGEGFYSLQPQVQLPAGVSLVGTLPAVDLLLRTPPTPTPSPSPEGEEQPTPETTTTVETTTPTPEPTTTIQPTATP